MNYMMLMFAALLLFSGCTATQETGMLPRQVLVKVSSFPPFNPNLSKDMSVRVAFRVFSDGTIAEARILKSGGDEAWNSAAAELMKQWRFNAVTDDPVPEGRWIQYSFIVRVEDPLVMTLGELEAAGQQEADSLYELLVGDVSFASMTKQIVPGSSRERARFLGTVDIAAYPKNVRDELRKLRVNHFTRPLRLGNSYVIYVRLDEDNNLVQ